MAMKHHADCDGFMNIHCKSEVVEYSNGEAFSVIECDCGWRMPEMVKRGSISHAELIKRANAQHTPTQEILCDLSCQDWPQ